MSTKKIHKIKEEDQSDVPPESWTVNIKKSIGKEFGIAPGSFL